MKKLSQFIILSCFLALPTATVTAQHQVWFPKVTPEGKKIVRTYVDNLHYWQTMISRGYAEANPYLVTKDARPAGSIIRAGGIFMQDSPDVPITDDNNTTQSENSVFVSPQVEDILLNSNNSTDWSGSTASQLFGADYFYSQNAGESWGGSPTGAGQGNSGDPSTAIGWNGRWYIGKISNSFGQNVAYSTDEGQTWIDVVAGPSPGGYNILDKNHLWIDNAPSSPFEGYLYDGWTSFIDNDPDEGEIQIVRSTDAGLNWSSPYAVSSAVNAGSHNQGVNIQTGPDGEVYAFWSIYDSWPSDESAIGMAKSIDGGGIFTPAVRIIQNLKGIRSSSTSKNMRVNSFPVATVDISEGPYRGNVYVVWANIGVPGVNAGPDIDIYLIRSEDGGATWSAPIRVNQDPAGMGKEHFLPWITCDPAMGNLAVIYYDDRNTSSSECETWVSYSYDGGDTWTDMKVSDVSFTPDPIPGLAAGYFGDYLGISSNNMKVFPVWTDNRTGRALSYVSPLDLGPPPGQPYVTYHSNELSLIPGKERQNMNYGDSLYLSLGLQNIGDQPATSLTATLSSESPHIFVTDNTEPYGTMAAGEIKVMPDGYSFKVSDSIPDGLKIRFDVMVSDSDTAWVSHFKLESHAPNLKVTDFQINDLAQGNGNHLLDPGDTAEITVSVRNTGDFSCPNTMGTLVSQTDIVMVSTGPADLDTLTPGQEKSAVFTVIVDEEAPSGSGVNLLFTARSGYYHDSFNYQETVGVLVEDWETHTFTKYPWQFGGDKQWILDNTDPFEGIWCAESGWIYDQQSTELFVNYETAVDDSITFYRKVSSEADWDFLYFYVDGIQLGAWSGELPWERMSFPVTSGTHTFKWSYVKDIFLSVGEDRAWVDYIGFPPPILPAMNAGPDDTICAGSLCHLNGTGSQYDSLKWFTKGDGVFDSSAILTPVYTPGPNDIQNGSVKLILYGYGEYGINYNSLILNIGPVPQVEAAITPYDTLCHMQTAILSVDTLESGTYLWMPGEFTTPEIYVDTSVTGALGTTWFTITATNKFGCPGTDSIAVTFKDCTAVNEPSDAFRYSISPNPNDGRFVVRVHVFIPESITLRLYSVNRTLLWAEENIPVKKDLSRSFNFSDYSAGMYILEIERAGETQTQKILIRK